MAQNNNSYTRLEKLEIWTGSWLSVLLGAAVFFALAAEVEHVVSLLSLAILTGTLLTFGSLTLLHLILFVPASVFPSANFFSANIGAFLVSLLATIWTLLVGLLATILTLLLILVTRLAEFFFGSPIDCIRHKLEATRSTAIFHRAVIALQRMGHGEGGRRFFLLSTLFLIPLWFLGTVAATYVNLPFAESGRFLESVYRTVLTLGGTDNLLTLESKTGIQNPQIGYGLVVFRWLGLLLPFWIGLPPLFRWLIRLSERMSAEHALSNHYVIVGFGQVGAALARDIMAQSTRDRPGDSEPPIPVVIVDNGVSDDALAAIRRRGVLVIEQSAEDDEALERIGAHRAKGILVATGVSSRNIDITGRLARKIAARRQHLRMDRGPLADPPRLVPHIAERRLMDWVASSAGDRWRRGSIGKEGQSGETQRPRIWPFSADQTAVRRILARRPISEHARLRAVHRPHIVVLGFDSVADWLVPRLFQAGRTIDLEPPRVTVVLDSRDKQKPANATSSATQPGPFPGGNYDCGSDLQSDLQLDLQVLEYDFSELDSSLLELVTPTRPETMELARRLTGQKPPGQELPADLTEAALQPLADPVTTIFVCFGDDRSNLDIALQLRELVTRSRLWRAPVFVRLFEDSGLEEILARTDWEIDLQRVVDDFGQDDKTCTQQEIFNPPRDAAAQEAQLLYRLREALEELAKVVSRAKNSDAAEASESSVSGSQPATGPDHANHATAPADTIGRALESVSAKGAGTPEKLIARDLRRGDLEPNDAIRQWLIGLTGREESTTSLVRRLIHTIESGASNTESAPPADRPWNVLDFEYVASNRDQVDHLPEKLRGLGYRACRRADSDEGQPNRLRGPWPIQREMEQAALIFDGEFERPDRAFPPRLERAAILEHERWLIEKLTTGWCYGPERDNQRKVHPSLRPYQDLHKSPSEQRKDRSAVANIHSILAAGSSSRDWHPECAIGVLTDDRLANMAPSLSRVRCFADTVNQIMESVNELEANALRREFPWIYETAYHAPAEPGQTAAHSGSREDLAICALSDLDDPVSRCAVQRVRYWCRQAKGKSSPSSTRRPPSHPFRLMVPHVQGKHLDANGSQTKFLERLRQSADSDIERASDWWAVDLLPDGLPIAAASVRPGANPASNLVWPPNHANGNRPIGARVKARRARRPRSITSSGN